MADGRDEGPKNMNNDHPSTMNRRHALKWLTGSAAATAVAPSIAAPTETEAAPLAYPLRSAFHDPDFSKPITGSWQRLLSQEELKTTKALADLILPKDNHGPAASEVGVPEFIDEWVSAPYEPQREDGEVIRGGLGWLNTESFRRFETRFDELGLEQQSQIIDDICNEAKAVSMTGANFFAVFRQLALSGYYTHSATWKHLGYVGNVTMAGAYPGVPQEVIEKLGLQDVA